MSIIDKLGIKRIELYEGAGGYYVDAGEVRELEQQRNKMLEALIEHLLDFEARWEYNSPRTNPGLKDVYDMQKKAVEKACYPETWEQIKELL